MCIRDRVIAHFFTCHSGSAAFSTTLTSGLALSGLMGGIVMNCYASGYVRAPTQRMGTQVAKLLTSKKETSEEVRSSDV